MNRKSNIMVACFLLVLFLAACGQPSGASFQGASTPSGTASGGSSVPGNTTVPSAAFDAPENWEGEHPASLVRGWYNGQSVGAAYAERYLFLENGSFYYTANEMNAKERLRYADGTWTYENNTVHLTVFRKLMVDGGQVVENPGYGSRISFIEGGALVKHELPAGEYEQISLPLQMIEEDLGEYPYIAGGIALGDMKLYALPTVDYSEMLNYWDAYSYDVQT